MGFKDLQLVVLLLWLCLGHTLAEPGAENLEGSQTTPNSTKTGAYWNVSSKNPLLKMLQSSNGKFSFDLMLTNQSKDSCAAVVRRIPFNTTVWVANFKSNNFNPTSPVQKCFLNFTKEGRGLVLLSGNDTDKANWATLTTNLRSNEQFDTLLLDDNGVLDIDFQGDMLKKSVWQSFNDTSDTLIKGQILSQHNRMEAAEPNHMYSAGGIFSMRIQGPNLVIENGTSGYVTNSTIAGPRNNEDITYVGMDNALIAFYDKGNTSFFSSEIDWDYVKLESNGSLILRKYDGSRSKLVGNISDPPSVDPCPPDFCGPVGICSPGGNCSCPSEGFRTVTDKSGQFESCEKLESSEKPKSSRRTVASAFAGGAGAFVLLLLGVSAWGLVISRRRYLDAADRGVYDAAVAAGAAGKPPPQKLPPRYSYQDLGVSTGSFSHGFGKSSVYFGTLPHNSDTKIAVKALDDRGPRDKDFLAAVATMGRLSHPNLVPLLGFCKEGKHKMLVYELVNEGKSLSWLLFDAGAPTPDAATRRAIALGVARGLQHLHHNGVLHGGVKLENILIDAHRHPKLVDYGLLGLWTRSKALQAADQRGTRGYMAPESLHEGPLTTKADVYSLGVVMLELVSGRHCLFPEDLPTRRYLPAWGLAVLRHHDNDLDSALELADPRLDAHLLSETDQQVLKGMACVALRCVQADPALRPSMDEVVLMLNSELTVNVPPPSPALDDYADKLCTATQQGFIHSPSLSENSDMRHR